jgi:hypothetical protein
MSRQFAFVIENTPTDLKGKAALTVGARAGLDVQVWRFVWVASKMLGRSCRGAPLRCSRSRTYGTPPG